MNVNVPDMRIGNGPPASVLHASPLSAPPPLTAIAPPPQQTTPGARRTPVYGLIPAVAGSQHTLAIREAPKGEFKLSDLSSVKAELRRARARQSAAEAAYHAAAIADPTKQTKTYRDALAKATEEVNAVAMLTRRQIEIEAALAKRPVRVRVATVHEPAEVAAEIGNHPSYYVCLHDACRARRWDDEQSLRMDHPSHGEMVRTQTTHVFVVMCEAPLDPLDPDGEIVGFVAPVGRDGTSVARAESPRVSADEELAELRAQVAELRALLLESKGEKK